MKFKLGKTIVVAALMSWTLNANAVDTYDLNTNVLHMPYVIVDGANYAVTLQNQGNYVFNLGSAIPATDTSGEPDIFDAATGKVTLPQVVVGADTFKVELQLQAGGGYVFHLATAEVIAPVATPAPTPDPAIARGLAAYNAATPLSCGTAGACHGGDPTANLNRVMLGVNASVTRNAINTNVGGMGIITLSDADLEDIAAYLRSL